MFESWQAINLVFAIVMIPVIGGIARRLSVAPGRQQFWIAYLCMVGSFVFDIVENWMFPDLLNVLQHGLLATAGLLSLRAAMIVRRAVAG